MEIETGTDHVLASVNDGIGTITLNRPERRNAITPEMIDCLGRTILRLDSDSAVGCLVITGAGEAFCAGGDLLDSYDQARERGMPTEVDLEAVGVQLAQQRATVGRLHTARTPVIAAIPGAVAGAGLGFALAADLRVAHSRAVMVTAFARVALSGDYGVTWLLERLVGPAKARELLFLSPRLDAAACAEIGIFDRVCEDEHFEATTTELARRLADGPRAALRAIKRNLLDAPHLTLDESMAREIVRFKECGIVPDHPAAVEAFARKEQPRFNQP